MSSTLSVSDEPAQDVPEAISRIAALMADYNAPWSLCGGWAIDAWLGRVTREHGDDDISVFAGDNAALFEHLKDWQLVAHEPGVSTKGFWQGEALTPPSHIHGKFGEGPPPENFDNVQGFPLDIQVDDREGDEWVMRREPRVSMPLRDAVRVSPWGVPTAVPEALLFFKAMEPRRRDWRDFVAFLPHLTKGQSSWLRSAIERVDPEHPWVGALSWAISVSR